MPLPSSIADLSQTAGSNSPAGSESPTTADDYLRTYAAYIAQHRDGSGFAQEATVASAATADIGAAASMYVQITGTATISSFGINYNGPRFVRFAAAVTLTHNATTLILPGAANITTAAGDTALVVPNGNAASGWRVAAYTRAALVPGTPADGTVTSAKLASAQLTLPSALNEAGAVSLASAASVAIGAAASNNITITGTTAITSFDTITAGAVRRLTFSAALTLTHNATSLILPGAASITTAAGDVGHFVSLGAGNWRCVSYQKASGAATVAVTPSMLSQPFTQGTSVASTSGAAIDFTGIPSWVKRVSILLNGVSLSGTADILIQLGTSGGFTSTGYVARAGSINSTPSVGITDSTSGFPIRMAGAVNAFSGAMVVANVNSNTFVSSVAGSIASNIVNVGGGTVTLSSTLDRIRITTTNGTDTFDAGSINILYE
jgi:hypothetical protein